METDQLITECLEYTSIEESCHELFGKLWMEIDNLKTLKECEELSEFIPSGMLKFRFNEKWKSLRMRSYESNT